MKKKIQRKASKEMSDKIDVMIQEQILMLLMKVKKKKKILLKKKMNIK